LARKLIRDAQVLFGRAGKFTRAKPVPGARQAQRQEARQMLDDARRIENQVVQRILDAADVLFVTLTGIESDLLGQRRFDLVVIDEACQTTEPACWIPLLRGQRVVLAGDHCQLPPTVLSCEAIRDGFAVSLMERLMELDADRISRQLNVQYRMHQDIMEFSSVEFYGGSLIADSSVAGHLLGDLPAITEAEITVQSLTFIDTAGAGYDEQREEPGRSHFNPPEANLVGTKARQLLETGVAPSQIAIITPYAAQVRYLREQLGNAGLEIDTVDGFQGREKEAVIISLVRSNASGEIGFLGDTRRMNVALTRARRSLIVIGDSATIGSAPFYHRLLEYVEQRGSYRTVWEE
jgi:predicted DNA helicase